MENGKWEMLQAVSSGKHCFKLSEKCSKWNTKTNANKMMLPTTKKYITKIQ